MITAVVVCWPDTTAIAFTMHLHEPTQRCGERQTLKGYLGAEAEELRGHVVMLACCLTVVEEHLHGLTSPLAVHDLIEA